MFNICSNKTDDTCSNKYLIKDMQNIIFICMKAIDFLSEILLIFNTYKNICYDFCGTFLVILVPSNSLNVCII